MSFLLHVSREAGENTRNDLSKWTEVDSHPMHRGMVSAFSFLQFSAFMAFVVAALRPLRLCGSMALFFSVFIDVSVVRFGFFGCGYAALSPLW